MLTLLAPLALALPPDGKCADEYQQCRFEGTAVVYYGAGKKWTSQTHTDGVACTNAVFGDPIFGVRKACHVEVEPSSMFVCEGDACTLRCSGKTCDLTASYTMTRGSDNPGEFRNLVETTEGLLVFSGHNLLYAMKPMTPAVAKHAYESGYPGAQRPEDVDFGTAFYSEETDTRFWCRRKPDVRCALATKGQRAHAMTPLAVVTPPVLEIARKQPGELVTDLRAPKLLPHGPLEVAPPPTPRPPAEPAAPAGLPEKVSRLYRMQSCWLVDQAEGGVWYTLTVDRDHINLREVRLDHWEVWSGTHFHQPDLFYAGSTNDQDSFTGGKLVVNFNQDGESGTYQAVGGGGVHTFWRWPAPGRHAGDVPKMTGAQCDLAMKDALSMVP